jgi:hypothetical protein
MWCRVGLVSTDVSEESVAFTFRVEKFSSEEERYQLASSSAFPPKRPFSEDTHGVTSQKTAFFLSTLFTFVHMNVILRSLFRVRQTKQTILEKYSLALFPSLDIHSSTIDANVLFILPLGVDK